MENSENSNDMVISIEKYKTKIRQRNETIVMLLLLLVVMMTIIIVTINWIDDVNESRINLIKERDSIEFLYKDANMYLQDEVNKYIKYKTLNTAIKAWDDATLQLKYKAGDIVYTKPDSIRVVISNISIGGTKNNYYIKYEIISDGFKYDIDPELIY